MAVIGARPEGLLGDLRWGVRRPARPKPASVRLRRTSIRRRRSAGLSLVLVVIGLAALLASLYLTQSSRIASTGYDITRLETRLDALDADRQDLLLEIGRAQSPAHIQARAAEIGLTPLSAESVQFASPLSDRHR